ncbi:MAG TPA: D-2-hydroxyacid dehydrogenase [Beijerinckiaceae bacterium]|nr:D-2-hydroxyacid dehydrogenase [Beijerinckiaceae bacterium]
MNAAPPRILVLLPWDASHRRQYETLIRAAQPDVEIATVDALQDAAERIGEVDVFMAFGAAIKRDIFAGARRLRWVHAFGTGLDGIVDQPGLDPRVIVTATRGIHGPPLSEIAILQMLALARDFPRSVRAQERHHWDRFRARLLFGKRAGILGVGQIACELAPRLKALGMEVVGFTRAKRDLAGFDRLYDRQDLIGRAASLDFLVLLAPLESETRHIISEAVLRALKSSAFLINIARGALVDEAALLAALVEGRIAGAALDTTEREPLPADDPLWDAPNLILTPHLGGFYETYVQDSIDQILFNLDRFRAGDFEAMKNREARG